MSGKEFDGWCVVREDEYKNKTDIFTCLIVDYFIMNNILAILKVNIECMVLVKFK